MQIILGSKSPGRKKILEKMGYQFTIMDPNIDEKSIRHLDPKELVLELAKAKAQKLLSSINQDAILITADQVVLCNNRILEKPKDFNEAKIYFHLHSQYPAKTISAIVVTNTKTKAQFSGVDIAEVFFKAIPEDIIAKIASQDYVLHCAGGFSLDDPLLKKYIEKIDGTEDSVTGLPIDLTKKLIEKTLRS